MFDFASYLISDRFQVKFQPNDEYSSPFAACFLILALNEIGMNPRDVIDINALFEEFETLKDDQGIYRYASEGSLKSEFQLTCFILSVKDLLGYPIESYDVLKVFKDYGNSVVQILDNIGVKKGLRGSGNSAMFFAILAQFDVNHTELISEWFDYHDSMESIWWTCNKDAYNHWQNGYHQLMVYNFYSREVPKSKDKYNSVLKCLNRDYSFSKWPGGDGCYDYDAVYALIMLESNIPKVILRGICRHITECMDVAGGVQNRWIRAYGLVLGTMISLTQIKVDFFTRMLSLLKFILLNKGRQKLIWSDHPRHLGGVNLWETWFRLAALRKVYVVLGYPKDKLKRYNSFKYNNIGHEK
jgi:hypothetical protein